jgi:hypothetical protein
MSVRLNDQFTSLIDHVKQLINNEAYPSHVSFIKRMLDVTRGGSLIGSVVRVESDSLWVQLKDARGRREGEPAQYPFLISTVDNTCAWVFVHC